MKFLKRLALIFLIVAQGAAYAQVSGPGVRTINSVGGAFTFTGSGVTCSGTTCTFSGGAAIPNTTNLINGSGTGNGTNSGITLGAAQSVLTLPSTAMLYFSGASATHGSYLNTPQLANGGLTGNYGNVLASSTWGAAATYYNNGVYGDTSAQVLTNYTTDVTITDGNPSSTVTVPNPHGRLQACAAAGGPCYFFLAADMVGNDKTAGLTTTQTINNLTSIASAAQADGATVILSTDYGHSLGIGQQDPDQVVMAAVLAGQIPTGPTGSKVPWIVDLTNVEGNDLTNTLFITSGHPNAVYHSFWADAAGWVVRLNGNANVNAGKGVSTYYQKFQNGLDVVSNFPSNTGLVIESGVNTAFAGLTLKDTTLNQLPLSIAYSPSGTSFQTGYIWFNTDTSSRQINHLWNGTLGWSETNTQVKFNIATSSKVVEQSVGTAIASAATIAPTSGITHVTGTASITTITPPTGMGSGIGGCITLIADAAWPVATGGNIINAFTAVVNTPYTACYDATSWYIK